MRMLVRVLVLAVVLFAGVTFLKIGSPSAQAPPEPKNLKVLPKNMSRREVIDVMRSFSRGLGVRCTECHVSKVEGSDRPDDMDYAADKKPQKETARKMLKMVNSINDQISKMEFKGEVAQVGCVTCHHGVKRPETITAIMYKYFEKDSLDAAIAAYRDLRGKYYGSAAYDFSARSLNDVARGLAESKKDYVTSVKLIQLNLEYNPNDADTYALLGSIQMASGDKTAAMASLEKALQIDPNHTWAKMQLDKAKSGQ